MNTAAPVQGPRKIRKTITQFEQLTRLLVLSFAFALAHVFPHCMEEMVQLVDQGNTHRFELLDVTEEKNPTNDAGANVVKMQPCKDYAIVCADLFENRGLIYGDKIELHCDTNSHDFKFKLIN
uniref:TF-B3 domain-containing protein n=1 Tax=Solanum lycopersicum TaxID=4081 RepID=A0A3Q7IHE5_SOLLC